MRTHTPRDSRVTSCPITTAVETMKLFRGSGRWDRREDLLVVVERRMCRKHRRRERRDVELGHERVRECEKERKRDQKRDHVSRR